MKPIPTFDCGGCTACCTIVPFTDKDRRALSARKPLLTWEQHDDGWRWIITQARTTGRCPFVGPTGCTIHDTPDLPMVCRLYGTVHDQPLMQCAMGKAPKRALMLSEAEAFAHMEAAQ